MQAVATAEQPSTNPGAAPGAAVSGKGADLPELDDSRWAPALGLPCQLTVDLTLPGFRVADLLKLEPGSVVGTNWRVGHDVPLLINGTLIGWSEFEVVGNSLAVRLTELA